MHFTIAKLIYNDGIILNDLLILYHNVKFAISSALISSPLQYDLQSQQVPTESSLTYKTSL